MEFQAQNELVHASSSPPEPPNQVIELINKKVTVKSKDKDGKGNVELIIEKGELEIVPVHNCATANENSVEGTNSKTQKLTLKSSSSIDEVVLQGEVQEHALQNNVVLKNIAKYLPPKDLASARLTCKLWSNILKQNQTLKLTPNNLKEFLIYSTNMTTPGEFCKYHIVNVSFFNEDIPILFNLYGKTMKWLKITIVRLNSGHLNMTQFRSNIILLAPNLTHLLVEDRRQLANLEPEVDDNGETKLRFWNEGPLFTEEFPIRTLPKLREIRFEILDSEIHSSHDFLKDLIGASVNLEVLSISAGYLGEIKPNSCTVSALRKKVVGLDKLKKLAIYDLQESELNGLIELSQRRSNALALRKLDFSISLWSSDGTFGSDATTMFALDKFLQLQEGSLKSLGVHTNWDMEDELAPPDPPRYQQLILPPLHKLKKLGLHLNHIGQKVDFQTQPSFLKGFPGLKKLTYANDLSVYTDDGEVNAKPSLEAARWEKHTKHSYPHPNLKELKITYINSSKKLYKLAELLPNLVKLQIEITCYKLIPDLWCWNKWPLLEDLCITKNPDDVDVEDEGFSIDEYITGIPTEYHSTCLLSCTSGLNIGNWQEFKTTPGISDLKHLRKLKLELRMDINDVSAFFGFAHENSKLNYLMISSSNFISGECRVAIRDILGQSACILYND